MSGNDEVKPVSGVNEEKYEALKLGNQICFPLYACAKEIIRKYKPYLDDIDLTYTQYITMMVLWEKKSVNVKTLGECLYLDSGTLTPVLKKLESKGYITRERSNEDERNLVVTITKEGDELRDKAVDIPRNMGTCVKLSAEEAKTLYELLYKIIGNVR
ncbi:MAG: MarR family transcriptional regulator [Butyrivibrio sp.]|nr:MarR family transcriptional regulator [Butyrivibrio sp.]MBQ9590910.1 MarR family transcriptional regulator [Butyrivibrio sp.]